MDVDQAEASHRGLVVGEDEVSETFAERKAAGYATEAEYRAYLERSGMTEADPRWRVRMDLLFEVVGAHVRAPAGGDPARSDEFSRPASSSRQGQR